MKKRFSLLLAVLITALCLSFAACDSSTDYVDDDDDDDKDSKSDRKDKDDVENDEDEARTRERRKDRDGDPKPKATLDPNSPPAEESQSSPDYSGVLGTKTYELLDVINAKDYTLITELSGITVEVYRKGDDMRVEAIGTASAVIGDRYYAVISDASKTATYSPLEPGDLKILENTAADLIFFELNGATVVSTGKRQVPLKGFIGEYDYEELTQTIGENIFTYFDENGELVAVEYPNALTGENLCAILTIKKGVPDGKFIIPDDYTVTEE